MTDRRSFLAATGAALVLASGRGLAAPRAPLVPTPIEAMAHDHGILRRVMYLYDECAARLAAKQEVPLDTLGACAATIRRVIEDVHERIEEELVFPQVERLEKLTSILRKQHAAGRALTDQVLALRKGETCEHLATCLRAFTKMHRPHADREDTILLPALRDAVGPAGYRELGEQLAERMRQLVGDGDRALEDVARLEQELGVDDLAKLTA